MVTVDPTLSLESSVDRLSTSLAQLLAHVEQFAEDVRDAQQDMVDLFEKLTSLETSLETLEKDLQNPSVQYPERQKKNLKRMTDDSDRITREMLALLTSASSDDEGCHVQWEGFLRTRVAQLQDALEADRRAIVLMLRRKESTIETQDVPNRNLDPARAETESMLSVSQSLLESAPVPYAREDPYARPGEPARFTKPRSQNTQSTFITRLHARNGSDHANDERRNKQPDANVITESPSEMRGTWHQVVNTRPESISESSRAHLAEIQATSSANAWLRAQLAPHGTPPIRNPGERRSSTSHQIPDDWTNRQLIVDDRPFEQRREGNSDKEVVPSNVSIRSRHTIASMSEASTRGSTILQLERGELDEIAIAAAVKARGRLSDSERDKKDKELLKRVKEGAELSKIEDLLDRGADASASGPRNTVLTTEIQYSCRQPVIELLLSRGAEPNATSDGIPDYKILEGGNMERWKSKLGVGVSIDAVPFQVGILYLAALHTNIEIVKLLVSYGAALRPHAEPLSGEQRSRSFSLNSRPKLDRKNSSGSQTGTHRSALLVAAEKDKWDIVKFLLLHGADANERGGKFETTLQNATAMNKKDIMQLLINRGADVNIQGGNYGTALIAAAYESHPTAAKILLDAGANINMQSKKYGTALNAAVLNGYLNVVKLLLERGADTKIGYVLDTALQRLRDDPENSNRKAIVRNLEARGAKLGPADKKVPEWAGLFSDTY